MNLRIHLPKITPIQWVIIGLTVVAIATFVLRYFTKIPEKEVLENVQVPGAFSLPTNSVEIIIQAQVPQTPQELTTFAVQKSVKTVEEISKILNTTERLGENSFLSPDRTKTLVYTGETQAVSYTNSGTFGEVNTAAFVPVQADIAAQKALAFIQSIFGAIPVTPDTDTIEYLRADEAEHDEPVEKDKATMAAISFVYSVDGKPVYVNNQRKSPIKVYVDGTGTIVKADFSLTQFVPKDSQTVRPISFSDAIKDKNNIFLLSVSNPSLTKLPFDQMSKLTIQSIALEYRLDSNRSLLIPMYRCAGTAVYTTTTIESEIEFVIPAVVTKRV